MHWVGLTGGIGSGKTTVAALFRECHHTPLINADEIVTQLYAPGGQALSTIAASFGDDLIDQSGNLNKALLRQRVLTNDSMRSMLEAIIHPLIDTEIAKQKQNAQGAYGMIEIPLLLEKPQFQKQIDRILVVVTAKDLRIGRLRRRGLVDADIQSFIALQMTDQERIKYADDIINNDGDIDHLTHQVKQLDDFYRGYFCHE